MRPPPSESMTQLGIQCINREKKNLRVTDVQKKTQVARQIHHFYNRIIYLILNRNETTTASRVTFYL